MGMSREKVRVFCGCGASAKVRHEDIGHKVECGNCGGKFVAIDGVRRRGAPVPHLRAVSMATITADGTWDEV